MKNILFLEENFSMQGTTRALLDYAYYNQKILGNRSVLAFGKKQNNHPWENEPYKSLLESTFSSLEKNFEVLYYDMDHHKLLDFMRANKFDGVYNIKSGEPTGFYSNEFKMLIHAVFPQPMQNEHGHKFAYVSKYLSDICSGGRVPYVPHMINVPKIDKESAKKQVRSKLGIPDDAFVYGRIGGYNDFNIPFVYESIKKSLEARKDLYYVMICTNPFFEHERIKYVEPLYNIKEKYGYIAACDAMIHARHHGETFGLAIAEFCWMNKPIVSWKHGHGKGYIDILKNDGIFYEGPDDLLEILLKFRPENGRNYNSYLGFSPDNVMKQFESVYLKDL